MPRYVVLRHELPADAPRPSHWDFLLEAGDVLHAWALVQLPDTREPQSAVRLPDHRPEYLTYEGPVSGNRGTVAQWDAGEFAEVPSDGKARVVRLRGRRLNGVVRLTDDDGGPRYEYVAE